MGSRIRRVSSKLLAAVDLSWEDIDPTVEVDDYSYDFHNPREYYVYPPNTGAGAVRAVYCEHHTPLTSETGSVDVATWGAQTLPVDDCYAEAIAHYILHRAFSKEAEWALDPVRAKQHFELYLEAVNTKVMQDAEFSRQED